MSERIYTRCPACHKDTLTINDDRHLLCTWIYCPDPTAIDRIGEPTNRRTDALGGPLLSQQLAEAVSEAALEATNKIMLALGQMDVLDFETPSQSNSAWDGMLEDIQAAITAATAIQQAEIAALREELNQEKTTTETQRRWLQDRSFERDALHAELATVTLDLNKTRIARSANFEARRDDIERTCKAESELATTRERLAKCESDRQLLWGELCQVGFYFAGHHRFHYISERIKKTLAAQPLDRGAK